METTSTTQHRAVVNENVVGEFATFEEARTAAFAAFNRLARSRRNGASVRVVEFVGSRNLNTRWL